MEKTFDSGLFRKVMGQFATGVTVVTYLAEGEVRAMTANAFMSVSLDPPLAAIAVRRVSKFTSAISQGDRFGVSFLVESQKALSDHFGGRPAASIEPPFEYHGGIPLIRDSLAQLVLRTVHVHEAGDHLLYVGEVEHLELGRERRPLVFYSGGYTQITSRPPLVVWSGDAGC